TTAGSNLSITLLDTSSVGGRGGNVTAQASNGNLTIGSIDTSGSSSGRGGDVNANAGSTLSVGAITASGGLGGNITLTAITSISAGFLNSSGSSGNGGNVTLDPSGDVEVAAINADGGSSGRGGTVDITAGRFFRATSSFTNRDGLSSSISAAGGSGPGSVTIRHGGNGETPFVIGADFSVGDTSRINGTAAAITDGVTTFRRGESFEGSITRGNLQLITEDACTAGDACFFDERPAPVSPPTFTDNLTPQNKLQAILQQTGVKPALIYVSFVSNELPIASSVERQEAIASQQITDYLDRANPTATPLLSAQPSGDDVLDLLLVLPDGKVIRHRVDGVTRAMVVSGNQNLLRAITSPYYLQTTRYLAPAQQLYQWIIAPLKDDLVAAEIENIAFVVDSGLRTMPMAVLHDGQQFLVEQYSIGMMPSLSLTDTRYQDIRNLPVLAMGASDFDSLADLPAVPLELQTVASESRESVQLLNGDFTLANLLKERRDRSFGIVHLATHAVFNPGELDNSFIQLGDRRLGLDQLRQLQFNNPPVELLVLSACQTALGDPSAELGFGGLAVQAGVKTVLASLWSVSDTGTLGFMSEFYHQLRQAPTRSEALRQTQIAMLRGEIRIENGQLIVADDQTIPLPPDLASDSALNFRHPYYWAAFTMIGNPW
ncbi:MAG TPA: CHAT domain-containing protein, partial [Chroococcidiopsis sp.]